VIAKVWVTTKIIFETVNNNTKLKRAPFCSVTQFSEYSRLFNIRRVCLPARIEKILSNMPDTLQCWLFNFIVDSHHRSLKLFRVTSNEGTLITSYSKCHGINLTVVRSWDHKTYEVETSRPKYRQLSIHVTVEVWRRLVTLQSNILFVLK